jgi:hypothetical protein
MLDKSFVGNKINVYMDGGWSISGQIVSVDGEDHFFVKNEDGLGVVFYSKICAMVIGEEKKEERRKNKGRQRIVMPQTPKSNSSELNEEKYSNHPLHSETPGYNNMPFGPPSEKNEDEFSVFFGAAKTEKINFRVSGEGEDNEES